MMGSVAVKGKPSFHILICLVEIWDVEEGKGPMDEPSHPMMMSEVQSVEIEDTYKKLICDATVKFPRGAVIRKTLTDVNLDDELNSGKLSVDVTDAGIVEITRQGATSVVSTASFSVGQRIRIWLGYTERPDLAELGKVGKRGTSIYNDTDALDEYKGAMEKMFDGYVSKIGVELPVELKCENLASALKRVTCKKISITSKATVNDFLADDGKYKMLSGTGLSLHPLSKQSRFDLGKVNISSELTVADVLTEWAKYGICSYVTTYNGKPVIAVGRTYFNEPKNDSVISVSGSHTQPIEIDFGYNVANNGLSLTSTDKNFLAVEAQGVGSDGKFFSATVMRNPQYKEDGTGGSRYRVVGRGKLSKKEIQMGLKVAMKVDKSLYTIIPYHSRRNPITLEQLEEESIKYLESYNTNGIEGTLTLFGDLAVRTASCVCLVDNRYPGKNGDYVVEEVKTSFGTGGYRQTLKLPYCIRRKGNKENE